MKDEKTGNRVKSGVTAEPRDETIEWSIERCEEVGHRGASSNVLEDELFPYRVTT